jgi:SEC-C motif
MTAPPGRNAPCPCGSGRKYKHCCLRSATIPLPAYSARERTDAFAKLVRYAERDEFAGAARFGWELFWAGRLDRDPGASRREELEADEQCVAAFLHWLLLDEGQEPDSRTIADRFVAEQGGRLTPGERTYLDRMRASCLRLYEVVEVRPDEGLALKDLWTDQVVQVRERSATRQLARWDLMAVRVIEGPHGWPELEGIPYPYPPDSKGDLMAAFRRHYARLKSELPPDDSAAFFKRIGMVFHHLWVDHVAAPPVPQIVTAEGDPLTFAKVVFDVVDEAAVQAALRGHPALERQDDGSYVWLEDAEGHRRGLGTLVPTPKQLVVEATSRARAERGRAFVEDLIGDAVRFKATLYESLEAALARPPARRRKEDEVPPEVERELVTRFYEEHYRKWLDEPIPALGGRTPRHAARLKTVRPKLVDLLKGLENRMEHDRRAGRPAVDVEWMWDELGIQRP